jgi:hypothetical protein
LHHAHPSANNHNEGCAAHIMHVETLRDSEAAKAYPARETVVNRVSDPVGDGAQAALPSRAPRTHVPRGVPAGTLW